MGTKIDEFKKSECTLAQVEEQKVMKIKAGAKKSEIKEDDPDKWILITEW